MKSLGKMCSEAILNVKKNQGFTLSIEDTFSKKTHRGRGPFDPPGRLGLMVTYCVQENMYY